MDQSALHPPPRSGPTSPNEIFAVLPVTLCPRLENESPLGSSENLKLPTLMKLNKSYFLDLYIFCYGFWPADDPSKLPLCLDGAHLLSRG